jgi:D-galactarolactone isomerase
MVDVVFNLIGKPRSVLFLSILGNINANVPFSTGTQIPHLKVPPNAADCHHHIYNSRFPVDLASELRPPDATVAEYRLLQKRIGTTRNVIVQPSTYGTDNSGLVEALKLFGLSATRGIAVVNNDVSDEKLKELNTFGVRGIRFNFSRPGKGISLDMVEQLAKRIYDFNWHIQVVASANQILGGAEVWERIRCPVVFDHLGHVPSIHHPAFPFIVKLLKRKKAWVKLSGAYIHSQFGPPTYKDRSIVAKAYVREVPQQLVWGSDWPHPTARLDNKPDDALLLDLLAEWAPDETIRHHILVENPERLYGFPRMFKTLPR